MEQGRGEEDRIGSVENSSVPLNHLAPVFDAALAFHGGEDEAAGGSGEDDGEGEEGGEGWGKGREPVDEGTERGREDEAAKKAFDGFVWRDGGG